MGDQFAMGLIPRRTTSVKPASASSAILGNPRITGTNVNKTVAGRKGLSASRVAKPSTTRSLRNLSTQISNGLKTLEQKVVNGVKEVEHGAVNLINGGVQRTENRIGKVTNGLKQGMNMVVGGVDRLGQMEQNAVHSVSDNVVKPITHAVSNAGAAARTGISLITSGNASGANIGKVLTGVLPGSIQTAISKPINGVKQTIETVSHLPGRVAAGAQRVEDMADHLFSEVQHAPERVKQAILGGVSNVKSGAQHALEEVESTITGRVTAARGTFSNIKNEVTSGIHDVVSGARSVVPRLLDTGKTITTNIRDGIRKRAFALIIGVTLVGFLLWDNTRNARSEAYRFLREDALPAAAGISKNVRFLPL